MWACGLEDRGERGINAGLDFTPSVLYNEAFFLSRGCYMFYGALSLFAKKYSTFFLEALGIITFEQFHPKKADTEGEDIACNQSLPQQGRKKRICNVQSSNTTAMRQQSFY